MHADTLALLTGHSRGLGLAIADQLLARGIAVVGLSRTTSTELASRAPSLLQQEALDLADTGAVAAWLASERLSTLLAGRRRILLINNAGVVHPVGPLAVQDPAAIASAVAANVSAPLMLAAAIAHAGRDAAERRILHVSSGAGRNPMAGWSVYCATKAALDHHARAAALDQSPATRICSLAPGVIDTGMQADIRATPKEHFPALERFEAMKRDGALSTPEDCAQRLVAYLLSDRFGEQAVADLREVGNG